MLPFDPSFDGFVQEPLFSLQHTRLAYVSVTLGIRLHHTVADAGEFIMLARHLAELYHGLEMGGPTGTGTSAGAEAVFAAGPCRPLRRGTAGCPAVQSHAVLRAEGRW